VNPEWRDAANQVTGSGGTSYSYDANGNRTMTGYTTGTGNEMTSDGTYNYTYDANGSELTKTLISTGDKWTYEYNSHGEMNSAVETTSGSVVEQSINYKYDVFGNLLEEDVTVSGTTTTRYAYDMWDPAKAGATGTSGSDVWAVMNGSSSLTTRQIQGSGIDQHLAFVTSGGTVTWYLTDHLGSTRATINNSGTVQDSLKYDAYGNMTQSAPTAQPLYTFDGYLADKTTGYDIAGPRFYSPTTGKWMSQDPLGFDAGDSNLYRYVNNAPTNATDPSGLQPLPPPNFPGQPMAPLPNATPTPQAIQEWYNKFGNLQPLGPVPAPLPPVPSPEEWLAQQNSPPIPPPQFPGITGNANQGPPAGMALATSGLDLNELAGDVKNIDGSVVVRRERPPEGIRAIDAKAAGIQNDLYLTVRFLKEGEIFNYLSLSKGWTLQKTPTEGKVFQKDNGDSLTRYFQVSCDAVVTIRSKTGKDVRGLHIEQDLTDLGSIKYTDGVARAGVQRVDFSSKRDKQNSYYGGYWLYDGPGVSALDPYESNSVKNKDDFAHFPMEFFFEAHDFVEENPKIQMYWGFYVKADYGKPNANVNAITSFDRFGPVAAQRINPIIGKLSPWEGKSDF
jgi:RHS repeat-associated protein